jgi:leucine dehydrogenase
VSRHGPVSDPFTALSSAGVERAMLLQDERTGLRAVAVLDDMRLGPAVGGTRTRTYRSFTDALIEANQLARAMTIKCALAGLAAGGGKVVVLDHPEMNRAGAFAKLGAMIDDLGGLLWTSGDLGTNGADLAIMARHCRYVEADEVALSSAVATGVVHSMNACAKHAGRASLQGLVVAVQGCGVVGAAVAHALAAVGVKLLVADIDPEKTRYVAETTGAEVVSADSILTVQCDLLAPCAIGGVIDITVARSVKAWGICGAANNILQNPGAAELLKDRGVLFVPDVVSSAGAVIEGVGNRIMGIQDREPLLARLGRTTEMVLLAAENSDRTPSQVAVDMAMDRIEVANDETAK